VRCTRVGKSVTDQDDENRIAPGGFDVNGEETWKRTWHATFVRTDREGDLKAGAQRVAVRDQHFPERRAQIVRTVWATVRRATFSVAFRNITTYVILSP
jgi:hypothetical protein